MLSSVILNSVIRPTEERNHSKPSNESHVHNIYQTNEAKKKHKFWGGVGIKIKIIGNINRLHKSNSDETKWKTQLNHSLCQDTPSTFTLDVQNMPSEVISRIHKITCAFLLYALHEKTEIAQFETSFK